MLELCLGCHGIMLSLHPWTNWAVASQDPLFRVQRLPSPWMKGASGFPLRLNPRCSHLPLFSCQGLNLGS